MGSNCNTGFAGQRKHEQVNKLAKLCLDGLLTHEYNSQVSQKHYYKYLTLILTVLTSCSSDINDSRHII